MKKIAVIGVPGGWSSKLLADTVREKTGFSALVDPGTLVMDLSAERVCNAEVDLTEMDAIIVKKVGPYYSPNLLDRLEMLYYLSTRYGIPIFSDPLKIIRMLDRLACTVTLRAGAIPMPDTVITEDVDEAVATVERFASAIFKPLYTSKARGMRVVTANGSTEAEVRAFKDEGNPVMYIQRMISHADGFQDLGVAFLGGEYLATYARAGNADSWNTTTRSGGKYRAHEPGAEVIALAQKAQDLFGLDFTCVDVVVTDQGPQVFEVSAFGGFRGLLDANGIDAAGLYVDYVLRRIGA
ncbi:MAG: GAK system ATP-grasp enzyme [Desulfovibrionaceae bacterium]|jgi:ribosomal protein S6--L-glutamate ligase|nr:GAK system ATP-grasp enzyme [Desulfovibrionaceae bacterium]